MSQQSIPEAPIRVLCVDDHPLVLEGIAALINRQPDMGIVASARTAEEALPLFRQLRPDVTLMDLQLPAMSGLEAIRVIRSEDPHARIVVLTMYKGDEDIFRAIGAGAATYVLKDTLTADLVRVVRDVHKGGRTLPGTVEQLLAERAARPALTPRELQIVQLLAGGLRNREIGTELGITEQTAKVHVKRVLAKLKARDRSGAIAIAIRRGIVHIS